MGVGAFENVRNLKESRAFRRFRRDRSPPVDPFDEQRELSRCQMQRAFDDRRPDEPALLKALREKTEADPSQVKIFT